MSLPAGVLQYACGAKPVLGKGFLYSTDELESALAGPVAEVVFDDSGKADIAALLSSLLETDFEKSEVAKILEDPKPPENWRVGEAFAESYLTHQRDCLFPWPDGRDERKTGSSLPGADLVGFKKEDDENYFAFGEIKTSSEGKYPPGAMYGEKGLKQQIEDLKDNQKIKEDLIKYLGYRASTATWKGAYQSAFVKYIKNKDNIRVFGVLVRDVIPDVKDIKVRVEKLSEDTHTDMLIELLGIYLPEGSIPVLSSDVMGFRSTGGTE